MSTDPQPTRVRRVELRCSNVEASAEWYAAIVDIDIRELSEDRAVLGFADDDPLLVLTRSGQPGPALKVAAGLFHTAFRYSERSALATAMVRIDTAPRVGLTGASDHAVSEALYLDDPDGIGVELYWDRPREMWPRPAGGDAIPLVSDPLDFAGLAAEATGAPAEHIDVGHVHLKVADTGAAAEFWTTEAGMDVIARWSDQAVFCAYDGYHHHLGANSWQSHGAELEPADRPGLERVVFSAGPERAAGTLTTPDGVEIVFE